MKSRDFRNYIIITKRPKYSFHAKGEVKELFNFSEDLDKTFWIYDKRTGEFIGRYSIESAPKWMMRVYKILVKDD